MVSWEAEKVTLEVKAAKLGAQGIAIIVLIIFVLIILGVIAWHWNDYQALLKKDEAAESVSVVTSKATDALGTAQQAQQDIHFTIEDNRSKQDAAYAQVIQANPDAATWDATVIPDSVRNSDGSP